MTGQSKNIAAVVSTLAGLITGLVALIFPIAYFLISYQHVKGVLESEAEINAKTVSQQISMNPKMWEYEQIRLEGLLSRRPPGVDGEIRRIYNKENEVVAESADQVSRPFINQSADLYDSGTVIGRLVIYRSLLPLMAKTGLLALITMPLGLAVFMMLRNIPIRALYNAEISLKESETRFRRLSQEFETILDSTADALFLISQDLKVIWANKGAGLLLGRELTGISGHDCYELLHGRSTPCPNCYVMKSLHTGLPESYSFSSLDGKILESRAFPMKDDNGEIAGTLVIMTDVTEKSFLQAEAMRAGHLATIGELAAGVAHEINNPINGIINYAQMMADMSVEESREHELAGRIIKEGDRIAVIVGSLLAFAREKKSGKARIGVGKIIEETFALIGAQLEKDGITTTTDVPEGIPEVLVNPQQIQQVFLNIISNARYALNLKYSGPHENKRLEIQCSEVGDYGSGYVRITFLDRGAGIPEDILAKVTDPFFSTKPSGHGTGLGLSISYGILKDHGGRLSIDSIQGNFTRVSVDLPVAAYGT